MFYARKMSRVLGFILSFSLITNFVVADEVTVVTSLGNITGETEKAMFAGSAVDVTKFLGIPFAEPPIGSLRFSKPIEKGPFEDTFIANTVSAQCVQNWPQLRTLGLDPATVRMDEDCLYLNIFIPGREYTFNSQNRAVMIWIHGGAFQVGSQDSYVAKAFVALNDVILVTLNYRLSFLGFMSTGEDNWSGNYGLWDQHMAIMWVNKHIRSFGGDPQRVTIFGESAGSASVIYQAMYVGNSGLFQRIIAQSGSANSPWAYEPDPSEKYRSFANKSKCLNETTSTRSVIQCLRNLPVSEITELVEYEDEFNPVRDGNFVTVHPTDVFLNATDESWSLLKRIGKLDLIIGVNSAEGGMMIPLVDALIGAKGYSQEAFDDIIVPSGIKLAKLKKSVTLSKALIHQYSDWSDPNNEDKIFKNTVDLISDILFNNPVTRATLAHADTDENGQLFFYVFDYNGVLSDDRLDGASHAEEVPFALGFPAAYRFIYTMYGLTVSENEYELSRKLMKYWTNFAKTG